MIFTSILLFQPLTFSSNLVFHVRGYSHQAKVGAKAKRSNDKENSQRINDKNQRNFWLSLCVNGPYISPVVCAVHIIVERTMFTMLTVCDCRVVEFAVGPGDPSCVDRGESPAAANPRDIRNTVTNTAPDRTHSGTSSLKAHLHVPSTFLYRLKMGSM